MPRADNPSRVVGYLQSDTLGGNSRIKFQYNPESITVSKGNEYNKESIQGLPSPLLSFKHGAAQTTSFPLFFDAHHEPDKDHVEEELDQLRRLMVPLDYNGSPVTAPPQWGEGQRYSISAGAVGGVPPNVTVGLGDRVWETKITKIKVEEQKHGTTPATKGTYKCTRAKVNIDFLVIEDQRLFVNFAGGRPQ